MISVIVITYNQEDTIGRALDSILMQQCHEPLEIVIGEDCSTDATRSVCQQYAQQHPDTIRLFCNNQNKGAVVNYFDCLLEARGEYIADCAGDDFWTDPLKLEKQLTVMEQHPDVTLVHTAWKFYDERNGQPGKTPQPHFRQPLTDGRQMLEAIVTQTRMPVIHLCTALYRADVFRREYEAQPQLFRNPDMGCEDLQIAFIMAKNGKIAYLDDVTLYYSQGRETVSTPADERKLFRFVRRVTSLSHYLVSRYKLYGTEIDRYFNYRTFALAMHAFRAHDHELAEEVRECERLWGTQRDLKMKLLMAVIGNKAAWAAALLVRRMAVAVKHLPAH